MASAWLARHGLGRLVKRDRVFFAKDLEDGFALFLDALGAELNQGRGSCDLGNIQNLTWRNVMLAPNQRLLVDGAWYYYQRLE